MIGIARIVWSVVDGIGLRTRDWCVVIIEGRLRDYGYETQKTRRADGGYSVVVETFVNPGGSWFSARESGRFDVVSRGRGATPLRALAEAYIAARRAGAMTTDEKATKA